MSSPVHTSGLDAPPQADPPFASIIIDNYNYGRFLRDAINSALAQTWPHLEVIVVDDGSTDDSREIIASYGMRIAPVLKQNGGQASAFNAGFARSRGDFVMFLDADDMLLPEATACVAAVWRPGIARVQFPLEHLDASGRSMGSISALVPMSTAEMRSMLLRGYVLNASATSGNAFSRKLLGAVLPMPEADWRISADTYLLALTPFIGEVVTLSTRLAAGRHHGGKGGLASRFSTADARHWLIHDRNALEALTGFLSKRGGGLPADWLLASPGHVATRLASLRLEPAEHPFPDDDRWTLLRKGLRACLTHPLYTQSTRTVYAAYLTGLALAPRSMLGSLAGLRQALLRSGRAAHKRRALASGAGGGA